jgi:hypothetical protein
MPEQWLMPPTGGGTVISPCYAPAQLAINFSFRKGTVLVHRLATLLFDAFSIMVHKVVAGLV